MLSGGVKSSTRTATSEPCATATVSGVSSLLENQKRPSSKTNQKLPRTGTPEGLTDATSAGRSGSSRKPLTSKAPGWFAATPTSSPTRTADQSPTTLTKPGIPRDQGFGDGSEGPLPRIARYSCQRQ